MNNGFLNVLKPSGMTAHDVVAVLRRLLNNRRIGHAGTLDPAAAGVLPVAVGSATRLIAHLFHEKGYRAEITFGITTSTLDAQGEVLHQAPMPISEEAVLAALDRFRGNIRQRAPMASAVQIQGRRLYSLARAGVEIERPVREVEIYSLELVRFVPGDFPQAILDIHCSAGTYIRSLAEDLGEALGGVAYLSFLLRTDACRMPIENAQTFKEIEADPHWLDPNQTLGHLPEFLLDEEKAQRFYHGQSLENPGLQGTIRMVHGQVLKGIAEAQDGIIKPKIVFHEEP